MRPDETPDEVRPPHQAGDLLRDSAAQGGLRSVAPHSAELRAAAYAIVWPLVWQRHTRQIELRRGHHACASSLAGMADACLDRFHDDVEAVVEYLFTNVREPVANLDGWIVSRIPMATVDGYRKRRGRRGALQRVRVPRWLATALGEAPELVDLAGWIIDWVGVPATAGIELWPLQAWADRRAVRAGVQVGPRTDQIAADVERVLSAMRLTRPRWYEAYIERPIGHKQAPTVLAPSCADGDIAVGAQVRAERLDAEFRALAAAATGAISDALAAGEDPATAVPRILRAVFLSGSHAAHTMDMAPGDEPADGTERLTVVFADEHTLARLVEEVLRVIAGPDDVRHDPERRA